MSENADNAERSLRLLVLDDDGSILTVFKRMLTRMGHQVTIAGTSQEAFAVFTEALSEPEPFDLVFVDLTMPGDLSGEEVIRRLRDLHPAVRMVAMSGYSTSSVLANHEELGIAGALVKPFDMQTLRELLDRM